MIKQGLPEIVSQTLDQRLADIDQEFKDFMGELVFKKEIGPENLKTFSPLDAVAGFSQKGLSALAEVNREEMIQNDDGFKKLLANMLGHCRPGALSDDDLEQISGINGRELGL